MVTEEQYSGGQNQIGDITIYSRVTKRTGTPYLLEDDGRRTGGESWEMPR